MEMLFYDGIVCKLLLTILLLCCIIFVNDLAENNDRGYGLVGNIDC